jgi:hypothetical protein
MGSGDNSLLTNLRNSFHIVMVKSTVMVMAAVMRVMATAMAAMVMVTAMATVMVTMPMLMGVEMMRTRRKQVPNAAGEAVEPSHVAYISAHMQI